jgi:hypothetical protein
MDREEFKKELDNYGERYSEEGGKIIIGKNKNSDINLQFLKTIPEGIIFCNNGSVNLNSLIHLPEEIFFNNEGDVYLNSLTSLSNGINFSNGRNVFLDSLTTIPNKTIFSRVKYVNLESIIGNRPISPVYSWAHNFFDSWEGNIKKIDPIKLLNKMISIGLFDRK